MFRMIKDLAAYEKEPDAVVVTEAQLQEDGFSSHPLFHLKISEMDEKVMGMALYYFAYSTWKGKYLYLEDFYVDPEYRGLGAGKKLFESVIEEAKRHKVRRMGWQVLDWNEPAIKFYERYQADLSDEWLNGRLYFEI
jgi:GNAT superfamily N-acetyltransferase